MNIKTINKKDVDIKQGRPVKYQKIYDLIRQLSEDEAKIIECDSPKIARRIYNAIRHKAKELNCEVFMKMSNVVVVNKIHIER